MTIDIDTLVTLALATFSIDGTIFPPQVQLTNNSCFDYIIVGGGTAGCVVASRLAQYNFSVLVLEAGGIPNVVSMAPGLFFALPQTSIDFNYQSTDNPYAASAQGNTTKLTSGKVLGGSSVLNHLLNIRGPPVDYNTWAEVTGDNTWAYNNFLKYFKKSEDMKDEEIAEKYGYYHGTAGPIGLSRLVSDDERVLEFLKAQVQAGNPEEEDLNSETNTGCTQPLYTIARDHENKTGGIRQSTSYSYFHTTKDLANLYVSTETRVRKIIFEDKTAVGVEAVYNGNTYIFKANKEVILSAGAFNSPQILHLSGIGPKEHLESLGIEVIADLPVGDNLRVPTAVVLVAKTKKHLIPLNVVDLLTALVPTKLPFPVILGSGARNKSSNIPSHQSYNLILPHDTPFLLLACTLVYRYTADICLDWQKQIVSRDAVHSVLVNLEAESTGTVRLNSTDIFDPPLIETGFYSKAKDLDNFVKNVKDFLLYLKTPTMTDMDAELVGVDIEKCAEYEFGSDDFWKCYILNRTISPYLYSGTCAMGIVVDGDLKLKEFNKIRIVDASVFPELMHGAINAAVIALAEKIAEQIVAE